MLKKELLIIRQDSATLKERNTLFFLSQSNFICLETFLAHFESYVWPPVHFQL